MKKIGEYTARGIVRENEPGGTNPQKIPLFDGSFSTAYRVVGFHIWGSSYNSASVPDCIGKLSKNAIGTTGGSDFMRADDDNQIAWAWFGASTDSGGSSSQAPIIDKDNLIVEDLYVYVRASGDDQEINYMVELEKYEISDWQGALSMARDRADGE